ncbi:MAG TPA: glycosyltransferase [Pyrinomonadaceae bacterium]|jgi:glycosyltransferase involved in cell wall biosynthesis
MKVLIGITTKNRALILPKAIESALAQDYPYKEVAVFDDASTDKTEGLRDSFPQVRWYRAEETQGITRARNRLMSETDADFYFSLDDDAWFIKGDEISVGVKLLEEQPEVAALAYDILSPDKPELSERSAPYRTHMYIGCGHLLRLSAARELEYYTPSPGFYGSEEKDLCVRLLDSGYEVMFLPGVHVWHDKAMLARSLPAQHASGVCNDFVFAFRRCPFPMVLWCLPGKAVSHLRFAIGHGFIKPCLEGMFLFLKSLHSVAATREPVSPLAFREFLRRSRASL